MAGQRLRYGGAIVAIGVATLVAYFVPLIGRATIDHAIAPNITTPAPTETTPPREASPDSPLVDSTKVDSTKVLSILDRVTPWIERMTSELWMAALLMIGLTATAGFFTFLKVRWSAGASEQIARKLRNQLYDHLQKLPSKYLDKADTGDLVQRCTSDVETMRLFLSAQVVEIANALILLCTALPLMIAIDVRMTLVSLALIPIIITFAIIFFIKVKYRFKAVEKAESEMTTVVQENLTGIRVVRAFAMQQYERDKFAAKNQAYRDHSFRLVSLMSIYWTASDFLVLLQMSAALGFGAYWITQGEMSVGTLYAFLAYLQMMLWPVRQMGRILTDLGKAVVALGRMREILDEPEETSPESRVRSPESKDDTDRISLAPAIAGRKTRCSGLGTPVSFRGQLDIEGLTFSHDGVHPVLSDISLHIEVGQTLAILGPSGAGKSTLMQLLLRLYDYEAGEIRVDGVELRSLPRQFVRSQVGVVMQEPFLFSKSLGENIRHGKSEAMPNEIEAAAQIAHIHETIVGFEQGYNTVIGERGVNLSGGQRQRIAIARAIVRNPAILILDDALSAVDSHTESMILGALKDRHGKRTTIVIAHRLSTLMQADQIIVLDHGKIVQQGTHDQLRQQQGMYQKLWRIQSSLEAELERDMQTT